jgi:uncharacterized repeat protein (TIGR03803 family)
MCSIRWGISHLALLWALAAAPPTSAAQAAESVLYSFTGAADGGLPTGAVTGIKEHGVLYGVTSQGGDLGACAGKGCGVVFELDPPPASGRAWIEQVLYRFKGGTDGAVPLAGLLLDKTGALYGTTSQGGGRGQCHSYSTSYFPVALVGCGTIFKLTPPAGGGSVWTETVLHRFNGVDGRTPIAPLLLDKSGALYGVTAWGGIARLRPGETDYCGVELNSFGESSVLSYSPSTGGCGVAFQLTPPAADGSVWTEKILHRFKTGPNEIVSADGAVPGAGLIADANGTLYGTSFLGGTRVIQDCGPNCESVAYFHGGTVFSLTPPTAAGVAWKKSILYEFPAYNGYETYSDIIAPKGRLSEDAAGALYGTLPIGKSGLGSVFKLAPPATGKTWTETTVHEFRGGNDGANPFAGLTANSAIGRFYGVTSKGGGGTGCSCGTVFELTPPAAGATQWREAVLHRFGKGRDGVAPQARMTTDEAGNLYGTTKTGGASGFGTVFKITP